MIRLFSFSEILPKGLVILDREETPLERSTVFEESLGMAPLLFEKRFSEYAVK